MVYVVHKPVAAFIGTWNEEFLSIFTFLVTICMVYDFANAFREAMDLRVLLVQVEDIKKRLSAVLEEEKENLSETVMEKKEQLLLHNPDSGYTGMDEESTEVKKRLLSKRRKS